MIGAGLTLFGHEGHGSTVARAPAAETIVENPEMATRALRAMEDNIVN